MTRIRLVNEISLSSTQLNLLRPGRLGPLTDISLMPIDSPDKARRDERYTAASDR